MENETSDVQPKRQGPHGTEI